MSARQERVLELSLEALALLGVEEVETEVSIMEAPIFIEAVDRGEVVPVDIRDPAGGFGGLDLWMATLVPVLAGALDLKEAGELSGPRLDRLIDEMVRQVGSPRARTQTDELRRVVRRTLGLDS